MHKSVTCRLTRLVSSRLQLPTLSCYLLEVIKETVVSISTFAIVDALAMTNISSDLDSAHLCSDAAKLCHRLIFICKSRVVKLCRFEGFSLSTFALCRRFMVIVGSDFCGVNFESINATWSFILQKIRIKG